MVLEIFKSFEDRFTWQNLLMEKYKVGKYLVEGQHIMLKTYYHEKIIANKESVSHSLMEEQNDDIKFLFDWGFCEVKIIDCSKRREDRSNTLVHWFELYVPPDRMTIEDVSFIREYFLPENEFGKVDLFNKYGIFDISN
jgi:hypothetical protein